MNTIEFNKELENESKINKHKISKEKKAGPMTVNLSENELKLIRILVDSIASNRYNVNNIMELQRPYRTAIVTKIVKAIKFFSDVDTLNR